MVNFFIYICVTTKVAKAVGSGYNEKVKNAKMRNQF